ncbi:DUF2939 domain-containing protein [Lysobacter olei]
MKKLLAVGLVLLVLLVGVWASGPFLAVHNIRKAIQAQDTAALSQHIDFPALRANIKLQLDDQLVRRAGADVQSSLLGAMALGMAGSLTDGMVDMLATPAGLGALIEGRGLLKRVTSADIDPNEKALNTAPSDPLEGAKYRFQSPSRFTITLHPQSEEPLVVGMTRDGMRWRVTDIRLPFDAGALAAE